MRQRSTRARRFRSAEVRRIGLLALLRCPDCRPSEAPDTLGAMKLTIRSHNTTAFDDFQKHAEKRLARLDHLLPRVDDVVVEMRHEETRQASHRYAVQVTVHAGSSIL